MVSCMYASGVIPIGTLVGSIISVNALTGSRSVCMYGKKGITVGLVHGGSRFWLMGCFGLNLSELCIKCFSDFRQSIRRVIHMDRA